MTHRLPTRRAFLVRFFDDTDPVAESFSGQVEHIQSGRRAEFTSHQELVTFCSDVLRGETEEPIS